MEQRRPALTVRHATARDSSDIARIYNEGIADRLATFETVLRTPADIATALAERADRYPSLVAEVDGEIIACAWISPYRARPCYTGIGEFSVYVARAQRGCGAGRQVLDALVQACEQRGFWKLVARVFPENDASRALCRRAGFREVGIYKRHAQLDGKWRDCVIVEKLLGDAARDTSLVRET